MSPVTHIAWKWEPFSTPSLSGVTGRSTGFCLNLLFSPQSYPASRKTYPSLSVGSEPFLGCQPTEMVGSQSLAVLNPGPFLEAGSCCERRKLTKFGPAPPDVTHARHWLYLPHWMLLRQGCSTTPKTMITFIHCLNPCGKLLTLADSLWHLPAASWSILAAPPPVWHWPATYSRWASHTRGAF